MSFPMLSRKSLMIILIVFSISFIFIAGYFIYQSLIKKENLPPKISNDNSLININSSANISESINLNIAVPTNSSEMLNVNAIDVQPRNTNQTGEVDPDAVLFDKAYAAGDRAICDQIKSEPSKLLCNIYIINAQAKEKKDPKLCDEIKDDFYHTDCLDNLTIYLAKKEKNKEKCAGLIDQKRLLECQSIVE